MTFLRFLFADIPQKIIALVVAVFLWFMAALDRNYVTSFSVPIELGEVTTSKIITDLETRYATVTVEGKGKDLAGIRMRNPLFRINVPELRAGFHKFALDPAGLNLPKSLKLHSIVPESVELRLSEAESRSVTVQIPAKGKPPKGFTTTFFPLADRVTLTGPRDDISLYPVVVTESLDLARCKESDTLFLRVLPPPAEGFTVAPETIPVLVDVDKEVARIFLAIPVLVLAPSARKVTVEPKEAQIAVSGPERLLHDLQPEDIVARVKITDQEPGKYRLAAEIILPPGLQLIRCVPEFFDVTVR